MRQLALFSVEAPYEPQSAPHSSEHWGREEWSAWQREQPHYCYRCSVLLNQKAVRQGSDGSIFCPTCLLDPVTWGC